VYLLSPNNICQNSNTNQRLQCWHKQQHIKSTGQSPSGQGLQCWHKQQHIKSTGQSPSGQRLQCWHKQQHIKSTGQSPSGQVCSRLDPEDASDLVYKADLLLDAAYLD
jgi:hypothetical protein